MTDYAKRIEELKNSHNKSWYHGTFADAFNNSRDAITLAEAILSELTAIRGAGGNLPKGGLAYPITRDWSDSVNG